MIAVSEGFMAVGWGTGEGAPLTVRGTKTTFISPRAIHPAILIYA